LFIMTGCDQTPEEENWYDVMPRASWSNFELVDTGQDWFEVYKLTDNTFAIYEPNQWQEAISYLLIGSEKALLVDTLQGIGDLKAVIDQITDLPIIVVNTHSHYDHVSSNYQFDTIYSINTTYTQNNAKGHPHADYVDSMTIDTVWKNLPENFSFEFYESKAYSIDKYLKNGETINIGNREIEVIQIPGHSPDSVMLIDEQNRMMFTGDSFYPAPLYVYSDTSSFQEFFLSTQLMFSRREDVDFLMPGHNETMLKAEYLNELRAATMAILNPQTPKTVENGRATYDFGDFSIITKEPHDFGVRRGE
ncbi:MAG: MBL fold metallo-hydrolase, partial [Kordiimonadaceae bacterium]|nr:MBL fold metallo-hydrolase [Kordiimonadaceae bacterium]